MAPVRRGRMAGLIAALFCAFALLCAVQPGKAANSTHLWSAVRAAARAGHIGKPASSKLREAATRLGAAGPPARSPQFWQSGRRAASGAGPGRGWEAQLRAAAASGRRKPASLARAVGLGLPGGDARGDAVAEAAALGRVVNVDVLPGDVLFFYPTHRLEPQPPMTQAIITHGRPDVASHVAIVVDGGHMSLVKTADGRSAAVLSARLQIVQADVTRGVEKTKLSAAVGAAPIAPLPQSALQHLRVRFGAQGDGEVVAQEVVARAHTAPFALDVKRPNITSSQLHAFVEAVRGFAGRSNEYAFGRGSQLVHDAAQVALESNFVASFSFSTMWRPYDPARGLFSMAISPEYLRHSNFFLQGSESPFNEAARADVIAPPFAPSRLRA